MDNLLIKKNKFFNQNLIVKKTSDYQVFSSKKHNNIKNVNNFFKKKTIKRILSGFILIILFFALWTSGTPQLYADIGSDVIVYLEPSAVYNGETIHINVSIPSHYNITSLTADMGGEHTIDLVLIDNKTDYHIWTGSWIVNDMAPGYHIAQIFGLNSGNVSYSASVEWQVLELVDNSTQNGSVPPEINMNDSLEPNNNERIPPSIEPDTNGTSDESDINLGLNLSISCEKSVYFVNETVFITGFISYNNSLINTSVILLINGPTYDSSVSVNVTDGEFYYQIIPPDIGNYIVRASVFYQNQTVEKEMEFHVLSTLLNQTLEIPDLHIWDDTDYQIRDTGEQICFYVTYNNTDNIIDNFSCLLSFNIESWTKPVVMNLNDGVYTYNRSFKIEGLIPYQVICTAPGYENYTVISNCVISVKKADNFVAVSVVEIDKPVKWMKRFDFSGNLSVNIPRYAYNITVGGNISDDTVVLFNNGSKKSLEEYNDKKWMSVEAHRLTHLFKKIKNDDSYFETKKEIYSLYRQLKNNAPIENDFSLSLEEIEEYVSQISFVDTDVQLIISNGFGEVEVSYYAEGPEVTDIQVSKFTKQVIVSSEAHYENVSAYCSINDTPRECVRLFWLSNGLHIPVPDVIYVDTNGNGLIDRLEWIIPHLSNETYLIVITKAEHLNENREFLADIYNEVYKKDDIWSEPIYHHEYVRVTFEGNLTKYNDITLYVRNPQGLDTIVEVYYYDSDEKITEFTIIGEEDFYKVYLTEMIGEHRTFDFRIKNLDNENSAYLEFDYIVDPTGWVSPTGNADPSGQWTTETSAYDDNTGSYASHTGSAGWGGFLELTLSSSIYSDRVRVFSDFGYGVVDRVDVDIYNSTSWIDKFNGTISDAAWTELAFSAETNVTKARFRYHYLVGGWSFWLYEFDFWQGQLHTLPSGTTLNATSIDESTVILNGNVSDDGGEPCEYRFQYGSNTSYGSNTTWGGSETKDSNYGTMVHNLILGNTYQYRVQVRNSIGTVNGSNKNFTTALPSLGWVTPTSHYDPNSQWENENNIYDDDTESYSRSLHNANDPDGEWSFYIYANHSVLLCNKVRFYAKGLTGDAVTIDSADLDVKRGGVWVDVFQGSFSDKQWVEKSFTQGSVDQARMRFHVNVNNGGLYYELYEFDFNNSRPVPTITNPGPANESRGITIKPQMNITVNNLDGNSMTISWYSNSSGSWQLFGTNSSISNGTYHQRNNNFSSNNTKYWWKVIVTDGTDMNTSWYYFSTTDTIKPTSNVDAITSYWKKTSPITITATASDTGGSGLKNVTLYYRFSGDNSSWGGWVSAGVDTASPWSWSLGFSNGSGFYQFYSIARDNATNVEDVPGSADAGCGYDTTAPSSSVNAISGYWKNAAATITATASDAMSGVKNVTLYYRFSSNNASWGGYVSAGVDTASLWSWSFAFSNGTGYYQFYSIVTDNATNAESAPGSADAICRYEANTTINIYPDEWNIGTTSIGNYNYSTSGYYFNLTNNGTIALDIQIKASNAINETTGTEWNLSSTPGFDNYSLQYNKSSGVWTNINQTYETFTTNLGIESWQTFDLNIFMATTSTKHDMLSVTITFRSVVP